MDTLMKRCRQPIKVGVQSFSILRLDGDTYESTIEGLRILYPRLSIGGFVIIDDYLDWHGAREATKDYREQHGIGGGPRRKNENLVAIYHDTGKREIPRGVYWQKMHHCWMQKYTYVLNKNTKKNS